ncbi:MAG: tryptophan synthase subunit alpha [Gemmatimonadaceae bacterium]|nr:tryptophan synthase subunit alpha [Chitinophagaceae bacterium]
MNRLIQLFEKKKSNILNVYCTAGYPSLESTVPVMKALQDNGADIIELGMPYSDPLADGPVIQASSSKALENGMTIERLFDQLRGFRHQVYVPVILMGYMNPVLQYGFEKFCQHAADVAVDGFIIPDLPVHEFNNEYGAMMQRFGLSFTFLVTPETPMERVHMLDSLSTGFLYAVSSSSTTGSGGDKGDITQYLQKLKDADLKNPVLVGFGIKDKASFDQACAYTNGAIIGTAYINAITANPDIEKATKEFLTSIK